MDEQGIKRALLEVMNENTFQEIIKEQVKAAVAEQMRTVVAEMKAAVAEQVKAAVAEQVKTVVAVAVAEEASARIVEVGALKEELAETKRQLNDLEQYSRRACLNISNIPEGGRAEDTDQLVIDVAKMAGVTLTRADIDVSHRIGTARPGKIRTIVARFAQFSKRQQLFDARRQLRQPRSIPGSSLTTDVAQRAFISDNLTKDNQYVMYRARQYKKEGKLHSAWSDVGKMKVRLREAAPTTIIRCLADLLKLVEQGPQAASPPGAAAAGPGNADGYTIVTRGRSRTGQ